MTTSFVFSPAEDAPGAFDGECISTPKIIPSGPQDVARIAREAGEIFIERRKAAIDNSR